MLNKIQRLVDDTYNVIVCCNSEIYKNALREEIMQKFSIYKEYCATVATATEVTSIKHETIMPPLIGNKWLVEIDEEKLGIKETMRCLVNANDNSINLIYVKKYKDYKYLIGLDSIKRLGIRSASLYLNKLDFGDLMYFVKKLFGENYTRYISDETITILNKEYNTTPEKVLQLLIRVKSGLQITTKQDIIRAIGVGKNSAISLTLSILLREVKTTTGMKKYLKEDLQRLKDLSLDIGWYAIRSAMIETLDKFIEIKGWIIKGSYNKIHKQMPKYADDKVMSAYIKYDWALFDKITMGKLLQLRDMLSFEDRELGDDMELWFMQILYSFYGKELQKVEEV